MSPARHSDISDAKLVAYIDGELGIAETESVATALATNLEARDRLDRLKRGGRPFNEAFDVLLDAAPGLELQAMFADLVAKAPRAGKR